jgi:hypothetical protein
MRMITDPPPMLDQSLPEVRRAIELVRLELAMVRIECPGLTERQALREARRRCAGAMVSAANALDESERAALLCRTALRRLTPGVS